MDLPKVLIDGLTIVVLAVSVVTDLRSRRILNVVTFPAMLLGLGLHLLFWGWSETTGLGLKWSLIGLAAGGLPFLVFYAVDSKSFGLGDVKLMAAVGAMKGFPFVLGALFYVALVGGVLALVLLLWKGALVRTLAGIFRRKGEDEEKAKIFLPYGVAIAGGTIWALILEFSQRGMI